MKKLMLRAPMILLGAMLTACGSNGAGEGNTLSASSADATTSNPKDWPDLPSEGVEPIDSIETCVAIHAAVSDRLGGEKVAIAKRTLVPELFAEDFKGIKDTFVYRDLIEKLWPKAKEFYSRYSDTRFVSLDLPTNPRGTFVTSYSPVGPGFQDVKRYLTQHKPGVSTEFEWFTRIGRVKECAIELAFEKAWYGWYIVQDETQARAVEAARAAGKLKVRFNAYISDVSSEGNAPYEDPRLHLNVVLVQFLDDSGTVLATPVASETNPAVR